MSTKKIGVIKIIGGIMLISLLPTLHSYTEPLFNFSIPVLLVYLEVILGNSLFSKGIWDINVPNKIYKIKSKQELIKVHKKVLSHDYFYWYLVLFIIGLTGLFGLWDIFWAEGELLATLIFNFGLLIITVFYWYKIEKNYWVFLIIFLYLFLPAPKVLFANWWHLVLFGSMFQIIKINILKNKIGN